MTIIGIIFVAGGSFVLGMTVMAGIAAHIVRTCEERDVKEGYMWHKGKFYHITPFGEAN